MVIVSDTSLITNLAAVGRLNLLKELYTQVTIPTEVRDELILGGSGNNPGSEALADSWFVIESADSQERARLAQAYPALDSGEVAALALALQRSAHLILLDDKAARDAAKALNLPHIGVVGILLAAKSRGMTPLIKPILDDLRTRAGFRLADAVFQEALRQAGE